MTTTEDQVTQNNVTVVCEDDYESLEDSGFIVQCSWLSPDDEQCDHQIILNDLRDKDLCREHGGWVDYVEVTEDVSDCDSGWLCQIQEETQEE